MKRILIIILFLVSCLGIILTYQNCSDTKLSLVNKTKIQSSTSAQGLVCPLTGPTFGNPTKIIFVMDMSLSNLGGGRTQAVEVGSGVVFDHYLGVNTPTDQSALRLKVADDIINLTAPYQNFSYAVMGFGSSIMLGTYNDACTAPFIDDSQSARDSVQALRDIHNSDQSIGSVMFSQSPMPPWQMGNTSYLSAINCVKDKITADISRLGSSNQRPNYQIFFITDGKFTDETTEFIQTLQNLTQLATLNNTTMKFNPVYYGLPDEQAEASGTLNAMAQVVDPTVTTLVSTDFNSITATLNTRFQTTAQVSYKIKTFSAVNLTTSFHDAKPSSDSDMDGLGDDFEITRGLSPANARSSGVLDRLCFDRTGSTSCSLENITCTQNQNKFFMLNDCDIEYLFSSSTKPLTPGLDSDKDNISDYIEIVRGINPLVANAINDDDGDNISNISEINQGTNPLLNNLLQGPTPQQIISVNVSESNQTNNLCSKPGTQFNWQINNMPLVNTLSFTDQSIGGLFNFSHTQDENVILITFTAESLNSTVHPKLVYAALIKLKLNNTNNNISVSESEFKLIGAVK